MKKEMIAMIMIVNLSACTVGHSGQNGDDIHKVLNDYRWSLEEATDEGKRIEGLFVQADKPLALSFDEGRFALKNACNHIGGGYTLSGNILKIEQVINTHMACVDPAMNQLDRLALDYLQGEHELSVQQKGEHPLLSLKSDKAVLSWRGSITAQALYGKGETLFFEVASQKVTCQETGERCLQVREVHYDERGIKTVKDSDWRLLSVPIEGYKHQEGVENIIRVKRYRRDHSSSDADHTLYVYDMTVASSLVER